MTEFMVRDDIIDVRTFWKLRKVYDPFVRIINESGGYAFAAQIEELWADRGGKNLIKRMTEDKAVKTGRYKGQTFVYDTEASLKYIKYGDSKGDFTGVAKNSFSVSALTGKPSEKQLLSSALKFGILADNSREIRGVKVKGTLVEGIGKTEYRENIELLVERYGNRTYPDCKTPGTSDYEAYRKHKPQIINSLLGHYDCSKCAILPYLFLVINPEDTVIKLNIKFTIFDVGAEKSVSDYVSLAYKAYGLFNLQLQKNTIEFFVYTYSSERKQSLLNDFEHYHKTEWNEQIKSQKGWEAINVQEMEFPEINFHVDPILQEIMTKIKPISVKTRSEPLIQVGEYDDFYGPF